jgi:hypothetical protein
MKKILIASAVLVFIFIAIGDGEYEEAIAAQKNYCEMVSLYVQSNGESGWPDYEGTYEEHCK